MIFEILSAVVAVACAAASARRLALANAPMRLDPGLVLDALRAHGGARLLKRLTEAVADDERLADEQRFLAALAIDDEAEREALLGEELIELEGRAQRWARAPRVCASIASSAGFLFAAIALLNGLAVPGGQDWASSQAGVHQALGAALGALSLGIAAASFCAAVHVRARRLLRERMSDVARLVDSAPARVGPRADS